MSKRILISIIALSVAFVISVSVSIWAIFFRDRDEVLPPDYSPQDTDDNQIPIPDDPGGEIQTPEGGSAVNITYAENVTVDLSDEKATLYYANPSRSGQNVAIAVVVGEEVVLRSELITPGNMVTSLPLADRAKKKLTVGSYNAEIIVYCYHPETGEKAMVDTKGTVILTVSE
ncbi:MAG: hypothetical protein IKL59_06950 [Clostridia bacterium]|nr:hypothetical protein [Clostridia bacterium]